MRKSYTKWVEIYAIPNQLAETIAEKLMEFISRHSVPEALLSDQGRNYESNLFREALDLLDCHKVRTSAYHPECDGLSERFNRTYLEMVRSMINESQDNWDEVIPKVCFAYRTAVHATTKMTPFEMLYGRQPKFPGDLVYPPEIPIIELPPESYAEKQRQQFRLIYEKMEKQREVNIDRFKFNHDRKVRGGEFEIDDHVWVLNSQKKIGVCPKLSPKYVGPYQVVEKLNNLNYKVKRVDGKKKVLVHRNRLKRCFMRQDNIVVKRPGE